MSNNNNDFDKPQFRGLSPLKRMIMTQAEQELEGSSIGGVIIRFDESATDLDIQRFLTENRFNIKAKLMPGMYLVESMLREPTQQSLLRANLSPITLYAEPDAVPMLDQIPTDTDFNRQWPLRNTGQESGVAGIDINILPAWEITKGSPDIITAVIDTGLDSDHIEFKNQVVPGWNFTNNSSNTKDSHSHGTRVSSVVVAAENGVGVVGVAPKTKVMPMPLGGTSQIIQAIRFAEQNGARVVNMSFAYDHHVQSLKDAMEASSMFFTCSAGNVSTNNDVNLRSPGSYILDNKVSVASVRQTGAMSDFSCYGMQTVQLAAPGEYVLGASLGGKYELSAGTSHSAPHAAGVAALILSVNPKLKAKEVKQILMDNVTKLPSLNGKITTGGMLNAGKAVAAAVKTLDGGGGSISPPTGTGTLGTPTNVKVSNPTNTSLTIEWDAPLDTSNIMVYEIFRNGVKIAEVAKDAPRKYIDSGLSSNTDYIYQVRSSATSEMSKSITETTKSENVVSIQPPTNLRETGKTTNSISIAWNLPSSLTNVQGYRIYRNNEVATSTPNSVTSFVDTGLQANTTYTYRVEAYSQTGATASSDTKSISTLQVTQPSGGITYRINGEGTNRPTLAIANRSGSSIASSWRLEFNFSGTSPSVEWPANWASGTGGRVSTTVNGGLGVGSTTVIPMSAGTNTRISNVTVNGVTASKE